MEHVTGPDLQALREQAGLSRSQIAAQLGTSRHVAYNLEHQARVSPEQARRYLTAFQRALAARDSQPEARVA